MAEIGPSIPAHLLKKNEEPENGAEEPDIGPQLPNLKRKAPEPEQAQTNEVDNDSDSDDDYAPALPPEFQRPAEEPKEPPRKRVAGPALPPPGAQSRYKDDSDDDQVGPSLYLASYTEDEETAALRRIAEIEGRVKKAKEANEPKEEKMERGEWMTVPPEIARLGMTTEFKPRGFAKSAKDYNPDRSSWTDSPAEKQRKFLESQNQKAAGLPKAAPKEEEPELTSRDIEQARLAAAFNKARGPSLIDSFTRDYAGSKAMNDDDASKRGFDRDKDLVARRVDPKLRSKMIDESRQLDSRFGKGRYL